jgi:acyl-CoA dehydrogenase
LELLIEFLLKATPDEQQRKNIDYMLALGEMFTLAVYAQLILENLRHHPMADEVVDQIFSFMVREFAQFALHQLSNFVNSGEQQKYLRLMMKTPDINPAREQALWDKHLAALVGAYSMNQ